jgi:catechol 2,3-dioxygenase-like lactoylglutathione lyase family enzyme
VGRDEVAMSSASRTIGAITLLTEDLSASRSFYRDILDVPLVYEDDVSAVFQFADTMINLLDVSASKELFAPAVAGGSQDGPRTLFTIGVDDVDAECQRLEGLGVTLLNGPMDRPWGIRTASFADPSGHVWELAHDLPSEDA